MNATPRTVRHAALAALALLGLTASAMAADVTPLAPHRAVYEFEMTDAAAGSGIAGISGRMVYELNGSSCEGYTQNMRFVTVMTNQEGVETLNDLRNSSWEDGKGEKLRFSFNQLQNQVATDTSQGDATRSKMGGPIAVDVTKPKRKKVKIPDETYFPMQHARALIASAKASRNMVRGYLFDGSEKGEKYYWTNAVIGKKYGGSSVPLAAALKLPPQMETVASWPVTISYFEIGKDKEDSLPSYELHFRYYENGVTNDLKIDYGSFSIRGELKDLAFLNAGKCNEVAP